MLLEARSNYAEQFLLQTFCLQSCLKLFLHELYLNDCLLNYTCPISAHQSKPLIFIISTKLDTMPTFFLDKFLFEQRSPLKVLNHLC